MKNYRLYGKPPYETAVIHGGPGGSGEIAPVARELSKNYGIIEPLQTANSIDAQIAELYEALKSHATIPAVLIGWSWGAFISYMFAARYPSFVKKLVLISSGPFDAKYAESIMKVRKSRLSEQEQLYLDELKQQIQKADCSEQKRLFKLFAQIIYKADSYDPMPYPDEVIDYQADIFNAIWNEFVPLRKSGILLDMGKSIKCPVIAIQGDYDSHPVQGVEPLARVCKHFQSISMPHCGHCPWLEKQAKTRFYNILTSYLNA